MNKNPIVKALTETAKNKLEEAASMYIMLFCMKHEFSIDDGFWVNDDIAQVFCVADYFFDFRDIKTDIDLQAEEDAIIKWYDYALEEHQAGNSAINFYAFLKLSQ